MTSSYLDVRQNQIVRKSDSSTLDTTIQGINNIKKLIHVQQQSHFKHSMLPTSKDSVSQHINSLYYGKYEILNAQLNKALALCNQLYSPGYTENSLSLLKERLVTEQEKLSLIQMQNKQVKREISVLTRPKRKFRHQQQMQQRYEKYVALSQGIKDEGKLTDSPSEQNQEVKEEQQEVQRTNERTQHHISEELQLEQLQVNVKNDTSRYEDHVAKIQEVINKQRHSTDVYDQHIKKIQNLIKEKKAKLYKFENHINEIQDKLNQQRQQLVKLSSENIQEEQQSNEQCNQKECQQHNEEQDVTQQRKPLDYNQHIDKLVNKLSQHKQQIQKYNNHVKQIVECIGKSRNGSKRYEDHIQNIINTIQDRRKVDLDISQRLEELSQRISSQQNAINEYDQNLQDMKRIVEGAKSQLSMPTRKQ